ncbi:unnamed protein product, partial [Tetraodon nigroviridis]
ELSVKTPPPNQSLMGHARFGYKNKHKNINISAHKIDGVFTCRLCVEPGRKPKARKLKKEGCRKKKERTVTTAAEVLAEGGVGMFSHDRCRFISMGCELAVIKASAFAGSFFYRLVTVAFVRIHPALEPGLLPAGGPTAVVPGVWMVNYGMAGREQRNPSAPRRRSVWQRPEKAGRLTLDADFRPGASFLPTIVVKFRVGFYRTVPFVRLSGGVWVSEVRLRHANRYRCLETLSNAPPIVAPPAVF